MSITSRPATVDVTPFDAVMTGEDAETDPLTRLIVLLTLALVGLHVNVGGGLPAGLVVMAALTPMWWRAFGRFEFARLIMVLLFAALIAGYYLASSASVDHAISRSGQRIYIILLLEGLAVTAAVLWGRTIFPLHIVAVAYGLGDFANAMLFTSRSWKYYLALPVTIIVVGWLGRLRSRAPATIALLGLGFITALDRGRSFFAFCVLAACVQIWQSIPTLTRSSGRGRRWTPALLLGVVGLGIYQLAIGFLTSGYLGQEAQQRTVTQIETSGSLILGGRPQWAATWGLMHERPWGYGLGAVPNARDYGIVSTAFRSLNLDEDGYIRNSMLLGQFRLHSITADLWVRCGVIGLILAATMAFAFIRTLSTLIARRQCPPIVALMAILALWYLAFEPTFSYSRDVFFALGVTLIPLAAKSEFDARRHDVVPDTVDVPDQSASTTLR